MSFLKETSNANNILGPEDISTISNLLMTLESVHISVGIPVLPIQGKRLELKEKFFSPMNEFIKVSLVNINTVKLNLYCEILENHSCSEVLYDNIEESLKVNSFVDRIFFPLIVSFLTFIFIFSILSGNIQEFNSTFLSSIFCALGSSTGASFTVLDSYRYKTFCGILKNEISRRQGNTKNINTRKIPIQTLNRTSSNPKFNEKTLSILLLFATMSL